MTQSRCRYCGTAIEQPATGRRRMFCTDAHRRLYSKAINATEPACPPPLVLLDRTTGSEAQMRALHAELRSTSKLCFRMANILEHRSDLPQHHWRFAAVGADLERSLDKNFADLEGKSL
jgi:hypothetical protein